MRGVSGVEHTQSEPLLPNVPDEVFSVDELLVRAGGFGRHQVRQSALCAACFSLSAGTLLLPNLLLPRVREELDLSEEHAALLDSLFFTGNTVGLLVWGVIGDIYGRRACVLAAILLLMAAGGGTFACSSLDAFYVMRTLTGFAVGGVMNASFLLVLEVCAPDDRMTGKQVLSAGGWVSGVLWLVAIAYAVRDAPWPLLGLYLAPAPILFFLLLGYLRESPRFLLTNGKRAEALSGLMQIGRLNRSALPSAVTLKGQPAAGTAGRGGGPFGESSIRARELFGPSLRVPTLLAGLAWFSSTSSYYGVVLAPPPFGDVDVYMQNLLGGLLELPVYLLLPCLGNRLGRSRAWMLFLLLCACGLLLTALLEALGALTGAAGLILAMVARFGATGASAICYVAAAEQWPTTSRNLGVGYGAALGRLGSILSPLVRLTPAPFAIIGGVSAVGALAAFSLPETNGKPIPETAEETSRQQILHRVQPRTEQHGAWRTLGEEQAGEVL